MRPPENKKREGLKNNNEGKTKEEGNKMRNFLMTSTAAPLLVVGYREPFHGYGYDYDRGYTHAEGADVVAAALLGGGETFEDEAIGTAGATGQIEASINGRIAEAISLKLEEHLNEMLEAGTLNVDELESAFIQGKDVNTDFDWPREFFAEVTYEHIPFARGEITLGGGVDVTMKYIGGGRFTLITNGNVSVELEGIEKEGLVRDIPYALSLDGSNTFGVDGSYTVMINRWRVRDMRADLTAKVVDSNITATGNVADRSVTATVGTMNLALKITNYDILRHPRSFGVQCSGDISMNLNDGVPASCAIASSFRTWE